MRFFTTPLSYSYRAVMGGDYTAPISEISNYKAGTDFNIRSIYLASVCKRKYSYLIILGVYCFSSQASAWNETVTISKISSFEWH